MIFSQKLDHLEGLKSILGYFQIILSSCLSREFHSLVKIFHFKSTLFEPLLLEPLGKIPKNGF